MNPVLEQAVTRLEAIIEEETAALKAGGSPHLSDITVRKNQSLLELTRLGRTISADTGDAPTRERLKAVAAAIEENRRTLDLHVRASQEITAVISRSIADADSDGTYGRHHGRPRNAVRDAYR